MKQTLGHKLPDLIMMIGPSGAGKSKIAKEIGHPIVSTDQIRTELYGIVDGKIAPEAYTREGFWKTFSAAEQIVKTYLKYGQSVIYDATNLTGHDRMTFLLSMGFFEAETPTQADVYYYVVDRPLEEKLESYKLAMCFKDGVPHTSEEIITRHHEKMRQNVEFLMSNRDTDKIKITIKDFRS